MKKRLTSTIVIGTICLLGVIYVQLSWIKINIELQKTNIQTRIVDIMQQTASEITLLVNKKTYFLKTPTTRKRAAKIKPIGAPLNSVIMSAAFYISPDSLTYILHEKFAEMGLTGVRFEYGIMRGNIVSLTSSAIKNDFLALINAPAERTMHYELTLQYHKSIPDFTQEDESNKEVLHFIVFDNIYFIIRELGYTIALNLLFSLVMIYIFYSTITSILRQDRIDIMKTNFINNMTHEFKTPITSISVATQLLSPKVAREQPQAFQNYVDMIKSENTRMLNLVETILRNATLARGEIRMDKTSNSLHELLTEITAPYLIILKNLSGKLHTNFRATDDTILIDTIHITNAITNILDNSIKYARPDVPPVISIYTHSDKERVWVYVEDNGMGMNKYNTKRVFEKFYRVQTSNVHNIKGFGLGLSYTRSIIEAHKGTIQIQSVVGVGTVIKISFPLYEDIDDEDENDGGGGG